MDFQYFALLIVAYCCGSISTAILVCKIFTLPDPRIAGSHNPGATNVLRIGGRKAALATLTGDIIKTALPLIIGHALQYDQWNLLWLGTASLLGHCFPIFYQLKGGKGVASLMTLLAIAAPAFGLFAMGCWLIVAWTFKRSSLASLITACLVPLLVYRFANELIWPVLSVSIIVFIRHRQNLHNIWRGNEPAIGQ